MGLRAQATDQHREESPPLYIRDSRPNPATIDVNPTDTGETIDVNPTDTGETGSIV